MDPSSAELQGDVIYQIGALQALSRAAGTRVRYVKPHGALYNTMAQDARQAADVIAAIRAVDPALPLVALAGAPVVEQARAAIAKIRAMLDSPKYRDHPALEFCDEQSDRLDSEFGPE